MLTPRFKVTQDAEFVYIDIFISNIRFDASSLQIVVDEALVVFHLSPYYLRLRLPHGVLEDERSTSQYASKEECIKLRLPKAIPGQEFEDLDIPSKLLARQNELLVTGKSDEAMPERGPLIQEVGDSSRLEETQELRAGEQFSWEIQQEVESGACGLASSKYGFDSQYSSIIGVSLHNGNDINELDDPEQTLAGDRVTERVRKENLKFDPEYYLSEYMTFKYGSGEDMAINGIKELLKYVPPCAREYLKWYKKAENKEVPMPVEFTEKEQETMVKHLPRKQFLVTDVKTLYLDILSLLFAHTFDQVENEGVHSSESAWTIGKLAPQLACLDQQIVPTELLGEAPIIKAIIITGIRRSLSYPLHRNYDLALKCWTYVYYLLRGGKRLVLRALLDIHDIFRHHDVYYVYNKILLDDLCSWFSANGSENVVRSLTVEVKAALDALQKSEVEFDCVAGINSETSELQWENLNLQEMELLAEQEYKHAPQASQT